ncbi:hypothetical protein [Nostoc sp.]|uniref:hypothetical protein n=1 Tax=Nostoc sp. TaxID=1180 RepID=UPI0035942EDC
MTLWLTKPLIKEFLSNTLIGLGINSFFGFTSNKKSFVLAEINSLVQRLSKLENVGQVRAVTYNNNDLHEITFEILSHADFDATRKLAEKATALVVETEWKVCDITKSEDWDFGTQILRDFGSNIKKNQIVTFSNAQSEYLSATS